MAAIDITRAFGSGDASVTRQLRDTGARVLSVLSDLPAPCVRRAVLLGPERSGKTSLLFHYALCRASDGVDVVFVSESREKVRRSCGGAD